MTQPAASPEPAPIGKGTLFALAEGKGASGQRDGDGSIRHLDRPGVSEAWTSSGPNDDEPAVARASLVPDLPRRATAFLAVVTNAEDTLVRCPIYAPPVGQ